MEMTSRKRNSKKEIEIEKVTPRDEKLLILMKK